MNSPTSDSLFRNLPPLHHESDGSWSYSNSLQVRMEAWSPTDEKWKNVEITEYAKTTNSGDVLLQEYSRGGHHSDSNQCLGSAMKGRFWEQHSSITKEVTHPAYTSNKNNIPISAMPSSYDNNKWQGYKTMIYNINENGNNYVKVETYVDPNAQNNDGTINIKNNWVKVGEYTDRGDWSTSSTDFNAGCSAIDSNYVHSYRQRDEILNTEGGTATQNLVAWRSDYAGIHWKYLSVREITAP